MGGGGGGGFLYSGEEYHHISKRVLKGWGVRRGGIWHGGEKLKMKNECELIS